MSSEMKYIGKSLPKERLIQLYTTPCDKSIVNTNIML